MNTRKSPVVSGAVAKKVATTSVPVCIDGTSVQRYTWEDALIDAQAFGMIDSPAAMFALKISRAINWVPTKHKQPGLYWANDEAFESVNTSRATYFRHRKALFEAGFLSEVNGNLVPTMPAQSQLETLKVSRDAMLLKFETARAAKKSQSETDQSQDETSQSQSETQQSQDETPFSVYTFSEDTFSEDVLTVDACGAGSLSTVRDEGDTTTIPDNSSLVDAVAIAPVDSFPDSLKEDVPLDSKEVGSMLNILNRQTEYEYYETKREETIEDMDDILDMLNETPVKGSSVEDWVRIAKTYVPVKTWDAYNAV